MKNIQSSTGLIGIPNNIVTINLANLSPASLALLVEAAGEAWEMSNDEDEDRELDNLKNRTIEEGRSNCGDEFNEYAKQAYSRVK